MQRTRWAICGGRGLGWAALAQVVALAGACGGNTVRGESASGGRGRDAVGGVQDSVTGSQCSAGTGGATRGGGGDWGALGGAGPGGAPGTLTPVAGVPQAPPDLQLFRTPVVYGVGSVPRATAIADLDHDGARDVVLATASPCGQLSIMKNDGAGQLAEAAYYSAGVRLQSLVLADLDGDGNVDVAAADTTGGAVQVLLGDGTGRLAFPRAYPTAKDPISVAAGDLNGDGVSDLAVANRGAATVSVLLNDGRGAFAEAVNYPTGPYPGAVAMGDLNGDGKQDLAVAANGAVVAVLFNDGPGSFAPATDYPFVAPASPTGSFLGTTALLVSDVDGDSNADVLVTRDDRDQVTVLPNAGGGQLSAPVDHATGFAPTSLAAGDMDGDGRIDIVVGGAGIGTFLGRDDGTLAPVRAYTGDARTMALADLNGDGRPDLLTTGADPDRAAVIFNNGDGTLATAGRQAPPSVVAPASVLADVDADGRLDLVGAYEPFGAENSWRLSALLNDGSGYFPARVGAGAGPSVSQYVAAGDWSGDGLPDVALAARKGADGAVAVFRNVGGGSFQAAGSYVTETGQGPITFGDWNGDGRLDLAAANAYRSSISVFLNLGDGTFAGADVYAVSLAPSSVAAADLDGDGRTDLAVASEIAKDVSLLLTKGASAVFAPAIRLPVGPVRVVLLGELDGDGHPDMVTNSGGQPGNEVVSIFLNDGMGTFATPVAYPVGARQLPVGLADLDGDGGTDIVTAGAGTVSVLFNRGAAAFSWPVSFSVDLASGLRLGDVNGDGAIDFVDAGGKVGVAFNLLGKR